MAHIPSINKSRNGQSLIELLIIIGLAALLIPAILTGFIYARNGKAQEEKRLSAIAYVGQMKEAMRVIRETSWSSIATNGTYHPQISGNNWILVAGTESSDGYTKQLTISNVVNGSQIDPSIKKITYTVTWSGSLNGNVTESEYLTRYLNNQVLTQTTKADFDAGVINNTLTTTNGDGTIELNIATNSAVLTDDFTTSGNYSFDTNKIEVTSGYAQLKNLGGSSSGQTTNSGFNANPTGWTFVSYGTDISQSGQYLATGGNPGGYVQITFPRNSNKQSGGYYYQGFTSTTSNPTSTLSFNWRVTAYPTNTTSFRIYAWIDTSPTGTPVTQVWDSGNITSTSAWSSTVSINTAPYITTPGTYYLKVGAFINISPGNKGPYILGLDNILLNWSGLGNAYANDSPTVTENNSFQPAQLISWSSFTSTEVTNGGSIRYQLSDDDGATWKYWDGLNWTTTVLPTNYNDAQTINTYINLFPITTGKIRVKAFLISDGSQLVRLDRIDIGYIATSSAPYSGSFTSSTIDAGTNVAFNRLVWSETNTINTTTKFQIATNNDNSTWNFVGPDGTAGTFFSNGSGAVPLPLVTGKYFKYQISFTSNNTDKPSVADVSINYSP